MVQIGLREVQLEGDLTIPQEAKGLVIFAHGSGSSRLSSRNRYVATELQKAPLATLLFDLLTEQEAVVDQEDAHLRFDIPFLAQRLLEVTRWVKNQPETAHLSIGYFGASTGAAAALVAAALNPDSVKAVVSRGGRPDLAKESLGSVQASTLLIVGGADETVLYLNRLALKELPGIKQLEIIPDATHLFEEPHALEKVTELAKEWFCKHL